MPGAPDALGGGGPRGPDAPAAGDVLRGAVDDFRVGALLGRGAFASVHEVRGGRSGVSAVVKSTLLSPNEPKALLFALREALALAHMPPHRGVPRLIDFIREDGAVHIVMGRAPGIELFTCLTERGNRMPEEETRCVVAGILSALRHAHAHGVAHRDVKLDNVFWDAASATVTLLDFGLSTFFDRNTVLEEPIGCINYASPALLRLTVEHEGMRPNQGHCDLWALGALTHGLLTGFFPFRSEDPRVLLKEIGPYGPRIRLRGCSDLAHHFVGVLLDPRNEGKLSASLLLRHPWVAPFADPAPGERAARDIPQIPSPVANLALATAAAEAAIDAAMPHHLAAMRRALFPTPAPPPPWRFERKGSHSSVASDSTAVEASSPPRAKAKEEDAASTGSGDTVGRLGKARRWLEGLRMR